MARIGLVHRRTGFVRVAEWFSRRRHEKVLAPGKIAVHNRRVLTSSMLLELSCEVDRCDV